MSVKKFEVAKKAVAECQTAIQQLQRKADALSESLPGLTQAVEAAEKAKTAALDAFALNECKETVNALNQARRMLSDAQTKRNDTNELVAATERTLKRQMFELGKLQAAADAARRECWQAIADEIRAAIPETVYDAVRELQIVGSQTGQTRQYLLDSLFPNPSTGEHQKTHRELCQKYSIG